MRGDGGIDEIEAEALQTAAGTLPFAMAVKAIEDGPWTARCRGIGCRRKA
jgi:hypothetical protein